MQKTGSDHARFVEALCKFAKKSGGLSFGLFAAARTSDKDYGMLLLRIQANMEEPAFANLIRSFAEVDRITALEKIADAYSDPADVVQQHHRMLKNALNPLKVEDAVPLLKDAATKGDGTFYESVRRVLTADTQDDAIAFLDTLLEYCSARMDIRAVRKTGSTLFLVLKDIIAAYPKK